ncbi:MAG: PAS domain S-box protein, partial [Campylobacterales bacterium]|nr:PAS domain S-box protein [Campylobacterales bacterium]
MFTKNYKIKKIKELKELNLKQFQSHKSLLIQLFIGISDEEKVLKLLKKIKKELPKSIIIGSSTDGEIIDGNVFEDSIVISLSSFENCELKASFVKNDNCSFESGKTLSSSILTDNTKAMILLSDGLNINGEEFLKGVESVVDLNNVVVSGGMAGDKGMFKQTFTIFDEQIIFNGAVGVSLNSDFLKAVNSVGFGWKAIGKKMVVTKSYKNRVYNIDNFTPVEVYEHYLGKEMANRLPEIGTEFPMIIEKDGLLVARAVLSKHEDNSLTFAGNIHEGDTIWLGCGNYELMMNDSYNAIENLSKYNFESIFVYSCMARRRYASNEFIEKEIVPLNKISPTSGFFTYGEFFSKKSCQLLNSTMTILALSEKENFDNSAKKMSVDVLKTNTNTVSALLNLIDTRIKELEDLNQNLENEINGATQKIEEKNLLLEQYKKYVDQVDAIIKIDLDGKITDVNKIFSELTGYVEDDLIGKHLSILFDDSFDKDFTEELFEVLVQNSSIYKEITKNVRKNGKPLIADTVFVPIFDKDKKFEYVVIYNDITDLFNQTEIIQDEKNLNQKIIDLSPSMILYFSREDGILKANKKFLEFFNVGSISEFRDLYSTLSEQFIEEDGLIYDFKDKEWIEYAISNCDKKHNVKLCDKKTLQEKIFELDISSFYKDTKQFFILNLSDVTDILNALN